VTIGIDVRPLQMHHKFRGIGMHMVFLLNELSSLIGPDDELLLFMDKELDDPLDQLSLSKDARIATAYFESRKLPARRLPKILRVPMEHHYTVAGALRSDKLSAADVFIGFDFMQGIPEVQNGKYIMVGYDLIPILFRGDYFPKFFVNLQHSGLKNAVFTSYIYYLYRLGARLAAQKASYILAISDATKEQFEAFVPESVGKVKTVYLGAPVKQDLAHVAMRQPRNILNTRYLLYIGGADARKRIDHLVFAFQKLKAIYPDLKLALAGKEFTSHAQVPNEETKMALKLAQHKRDIFLLGFISEAEKQALYEHALCFVYPTLSEGFGLPILEAFEYRCPVISYDYPYSSVKEVAGNAALIGPPEPNFIIQSVKDLIEDKSLADKLKEAGEARVQDFSWKQNAQQTLKYLRAAGTRDSPKER
jgi:glycosyltransferase involved in cell wall biosynthesis